MTHRQFWIAAWCVLAAGTPSLQAAPSAEARHEVQALAARIDAHIAAGWAAADAQPAPLADDAEFLRRVYLDLAGRIPSVTEARAFLDDPAPDKRARLIDRLVDSPRYVAHFTNVWRGLMLPEAQANLQARFLAPGFEAWLRKQLTRNAGYDRMVREILTAPIDPNAMQSIYNGTGEPSPLAFYFAKDLKPENLAASTARLFLGVRVECAQCHNHPFASWEREQFWSYAAFFGGIERQPQGDFVAPKREVADKRELAIPGTDRVAQARFLDGVEPQFRYKVNARVTLANWMTADDNPYFSRATVNRMWYFFFGSGLTEPVDDMVGAESRARHPELLDELAREFAEHQFDLKFLIRAITNSRTYQLTSAASHPSQEDAALFARASLRGLTAEHLYDSVAEAVGLPVARDNNRPYFQPNDRSPRAEFLARFAEQSGRPSEAQTSILQALALMNGKLVAGATSLQNSQTLTAVADAPFMATAERIETLYLATLGRKPARAREMDRLVKYVESAGAATTEGADAKDKNTNQALADVFWVLLNSGEFMLNH